MRCVRCRADTGGIFGSQAFADPARPVAQSGDVVPASTIAQSGHVVPADLAGRNVHRHSQCSAFPDSYADGDRRTATAKATATPKATKPTPTATGTPSPRDFQNTPVVTLDAGTLKRVTSGRLNSEDSALKMVPANHSYLVCLSPPQGWKSAGGTYRLPGWICVRQACRRYRRACELRARACVFVWGRGYRMSQPGGTRGPDERRRELVWSALFLLAGLIGGFAAADLAHVSTIRAAIVSVLIAAVVMLVAHYALPRSARNDARPVPQHTGSREVEGPRRPAPDSRGPDSRVRPAPDQVALVQVMEPRGAGHQILVESRRTHVGRRYAGSSRSPGHPGPVELPGLSAGRPVPELWLFPHGYRPDGTGVALPLPGMPADLGLAARKSMARDPGSTALAQRTIGETRCIRNRSAVRDQAALSFCWTAQIP